MRNSSATIRFLPALAADALLAAGCGAGEPGASYSITSIDISYTD